MDKFNLQRFVDAQDDCETYELAMTELKNGRKRSHWIWYIFPQLKGLGFSYNSTFYGISGKEEATAYLQHEVLGPRLRNACEIIIRQKDIGANRLLGNIDAQKVFSCLTLFDAIASDDIFSEALRLLYNSDRDQNTLKLLHP